MKERKGKRYQWGIFAAVLALCLIAGALLWGHSREQQQEQLQLQQEALAQLQAQEGTYDPQSIVLTNTSRTRAEAIAALAGGTLRITDSGSFATVTLPQGTTIYDFFSTEEAREWIPEMSADYHVSSAEVEELTRETAMPDYTVNDPDYSMQSYLSYLNIQNTWNVTKGSGVTVAVIDTGIDTDHLEFSGKISEYSYNATEDKIVKDYDLSIIEDTQGHGTAVAGVIAASMNDGCGIAGIAPDVTLLVIKAECDENGNFKRGSDLVFGLYYAIERDANIVNMSFGGPVNIYADAAQLAVDSDIICVAAAGNDGTCQLQYPAADENVIGVGALAPDSWELAAYSNYGDNTNVVAPGTVYTCAMGGSYKTMDGTSFSSPVAAAAIALYVSRNSYVEFADLTEVLYASCVDLGDSGEDTYYGYGAIDVYALVVAEKGTITFEMLTDEVENIQRVYVKGHTLQNIPLDVERNYAVFDGWYYGYDCAQEDELELYTTVFYEDITLYANWVNEDDGIPYTYVILDDGTVEIRSYTGKRRYITIPDEIEGRTVSSIGEGAFSGQTRLREITLPAGLVRIRDVAFYGCSLLTNVNIPDTVTEIGASAFADCARMRSISFGSESKLTTVGRFAFANTGLLRFELPKTVTAVDGSAFFGATSLTHVGVTAGNAGYTSENGVLFNATKDTLVAYPAGLGGEYALGAEVTAIGSYAFGYSAISNVSLANVTNIGGYAFAYSKLESVLIPDGVTALGEGAFANCRYLKTAEIGSGVQRIPAELFTYNAALTQIKLAENTVSIGQSAFFGCISLEDLDLSANTQLTLIDGSAFSWCFGLKTVKLAENGKLAAIGAGAFEKCIQLSSINLPKTLTVIGSSAFAYTGSLTEVTLPENLKQIGEKAFLSGGLSGTLTVPKGVEQIGAGAFADCDGLTKIDVQDGNAAYGDENGVVYTHDRKEIVAYPAGNAAKSYTVLDGTVTVGSYAFCGADNLTAITLPESLTEIKEYGFCEVTALKSISIPDNVTQIGRYAFSDCWKLQSVHFNETSKLPRISFAAFANTGITSFRVPANVSTIAQYAFANSNDLKTVTFAAGSKLDIIPAYLFAGSEQITSIIFEEGSQLSSIAAHGFEGMEKLTAIDFTNTKLTNVDNFAFRFCKSLGSIVLPEGVTEIGRYAFYACGALTDVTIPSTIDRIGRYAFLGAENANLYFAADVLPANLQENWDYGIKGYYTGVLGVSENAAWKYAALTEGGYAILDYYGAETTLNLNTVDLDGNGTADKIVTVGGYAFADTAIVSITLPDSLTGIQRYAFARTEKLEKITIPAQVTFIGQYAFYGSGLESLSFAAGAKINNIEQYAFASCRNLGSVAIPNSVTTLGTGVFAESGLSSVTFGTGLTEIPKKAFYKTRLTEVKLPAAVEKIGYYAFAGTETLKTVTFGTETELMVMGYAFSDCDIQSVTIPANVGYLGEFAFTGNKNLQSYTVAAGNAHYSGENGILYNKAKTKLIAYPAGRTGTFEVPAFVETIGFGAFEDSKLTKVTFAQGINLLTIGNRAFYGAALTEITIPASVVSIDYYAFATCEDLETVTFAPGTALRGIYEGAFLNCSSLTNITIPDAIVEISDFAFYGCRSLKALPLGENSAVKGVYDYAFAYTGLEGSLVLPDTLIDIGNYAFAGLKALSIQVPDAQRYDLIIGLGAFAECNELMEITLPFVGAMEGELELGYLGYIFGAGSYEANATYVPESLKTVTLLEGTTTLPTGAFYGITTLETVNVPHSVENVYAYAMDSCYAKYELTNVIQFWYADYYGDACQATHMNYGYVGYGIIGKLELREGLQEIGESAFYSCESLERVVLPDGVTKIGVNAFSFCSNLASVAIPETVTIIDDGAFSYCIRLCDITLPKNITRIGRDTFISCRSFTEFIIPETIQMIDERAFAGCYALSSITLPTGLQSIGADAFLECPNLYEVTNYSAIPITIGSTDHGQIGLNARVIVSADGTKQYKDDENFVFIVTKDQFKFSYYQGEYQLIAYVGDEETVTLPTDVFGNPYTLYQVSGNAKTVIIPDGWETIPDRAFAGNFTLECVIMPDSVTHVGTEAFNDCRSLKEVVLSKELVTIGESAFTATAIEQMIFPDSLKTIGDCAFQSCVALESITLQDGLERIGIFGFSGCHSLKEVIIPDSVTNLGYRSFAGCYSLAYVKLPEGITSIDTGTFEYTYALKTIHIPDTVKWIGQMAFFYSGLTEIQLPSSLAWLYDEAFAYCTGLTSIVIPDSVTYIDSYAFAGCTGIHSIHIPASVSDIHVSAFYKSGITELTIDEENQWFTVIDGIVYDKNVTKFVYVPSTVTSISVPATVEDVDLSGLENLVSVEFAPNSKVTSVNFRSCTSLKEIDIPYGVEAVEWRCFEDCTSLERVGFPKSLKRIGYGAFIGCSALKIMQLPENLENIEAAAFAGCSSLKEVVWPESIAIIPESVFSSCSKLTTVVLPEGLTAIDEHAFAHCYDLSSITIPSTVTLIGDSAFVSCEKLHYVENKSELNITIGSEGHGYVAFNAKILVDANGNVTYKDGYVPAETVDTADGWRFELVDGNYILTEYFGSADTATLPLEINGQNYILQLTSSPKHLIIPEGFTELGYMAFGGCDELESVSIPNTLTMIGDNAFYMCLSLKSVRIPGNVKTIGWAAFAYCFDLESIILEDGIEHINGRAFEDCRKLSDFSIPDSVKTIGAHAFGSTAYWNDRSNWNHGVCCYEDWVLGIDETAVYIPGNYKIATGLSSYTLKKIVTDGQQGIGNNFSNLETLVLTDYPASGIYWSIFYGNIPITLKNIVIPGGAGVLPNANVFENITGVEIWVNATKEDCGWDENYPGWNNGNIVHYSDEWIEVTFTDADGRIISNEYLSIFDIIKQPYVEPVTMDGDTSYTFLGWDMDGDGQVDSIPVTSLTDIRTTAVYEIHVHPTGSHEFGEVTVKNSTCVAMGYSQHSCTVCGYVERYDFVDKLGHDYLATQVDAGCEHIGGDKYTCQTCGDFYFENALPALGHKVDKWTVKAAASCTAEGSRTGKCAHCGETVTEVIPATGHNYTKTGTVAATCTEKGQEIYQCACGHRYVKELPETGHNYVRVNASKSFIQWLISMIKHILWGYDGDQPYYYQCTECRQIMLVGEEPTSSSGGISVNAFCIHSSTVETVEGNLTTAKCESCGVTVWVRYDGDGNECDHDYAAVVTDPTCTEQGYTTYTCTTCGHSYVDSYVEAVGHHYENGVCTVCGREELSVVLGDVNGDGEIDLLDANLVAAYYHELRDFDAEQLLAADVNGDGEVDLLDANLIAAYYHELLEKFPIE